MDGVVAAVNAMEDSGLFNAGRGACLTSAGTVELDAAVITGKGSRGAGVGSVTSTHRPVSLARWEMENTDHVLLVGAPCRAYAKAAGLKVEELRPSATSAARFRALMLKPEGRAKARALKAFQDGNTVGAVAIDGEGVPAAAVSTGGVWLKHPGRVGDSAVIGAGVFATDAGAACATGTGEEIIRASLCQKACEFLEKKDAQSAARRAIRLMTEGAGSGTAGIVTVDAAGRLGASFNTEAMGRAWFDHSKGRVVVRVT